MAFKLQNYKSVVSETAEIGKLPIDPRTDAAVLESQVRQKGFEAIQKTVSGIGDAFVELQGREAERTEQLKTKRLEQQRAIQKALEEAREKAHNNSRSIAYTKYTNALEEYGKTYAIASKTTNSDVLGIEKEDAIPVIDENENSKTFGKQIGSLYDIPLDVYKTNINNAKNAFNTTLYPEFKDKIDEDARHALSVSSLSAIENSIEGQATLNIATITAATTQLANGGKIQEALNIHEQNRYIYEATGKESDLVKWVEQRNKILEIGQELDFTKLAEINPLRAIEIGDAIINGTFNDMLFQPFEVEYPTQDGTTATFSSEDVNKVLNSTIFDFYKSAIEDFMLNENSTDKEKTLVKKELEKITDINVVKEDYMSYSSDVKKALLEMVEIEIEDMPEETEEQRKEKYIALNVINREKQNILFAPSLDLLGITKLRSIIGIAETQANENADKILDKTLRSENYLNMSVNEKINYLNNLINENQDDAAFVNIASSTIQTLSAKEPKPSAKQWIAIREALTLMDKPGMSKTAVFTAYAQRADAHSQGLELLAAKLDDKVNLSETGNQAINSKGLDLVEDIGKGRLLTRQTIMDRIRSGEIQPIFWNRGDETVNSNEDFAKLGPEAQQDIVNKLNDWALVELKRRYKERITSLKTPSGEPRTATFDEEVAIADQVYDEILLEFNPANIGTLRQKFINGQDISNYFSGQDLTDALRLFISGPNGVENQKLILELIEAANAATVAKELFD